MENAFLALWSNVRVTVRTSQHVQCDQFGRGLNFDDSTTSNFHITALQGDHSPCAKPPVDFKTKVPFRPGLPWPGQAKAELLIWSQREVLHKMNGHPVLRTALDPPCMMLSSRTTKKKRKAMLHPELPPRSTNRHRRRRLGRHLHRERNPPHREMSQTELSKMYRVTIQLVQNLPLTSNISSALAWPVLAWPDHNGTFF